MATLEDKILGDKMQNYCSSSEDEGDDNDSKSDSGDSHPKNASNLSSKTMGPPPDMEQWSGNSANTGPKGVIKDWQQFKAMQVQRREQKERDRLELINKLSITANSHLEDQKQMELDDMDAEMKELMDEDILLQFQKQRMLEMLSASGKIPTFGKLFSLSDGDEFLEAVDKEIKSVTVIVHIYENHMSACKVMNKCLESLARDYCHVKFCKIIGSLAGMSRLFKSSGIPALLVYKGGQLIGNFVRISNDLGDDFFPSDVEGFLIEHAMLPDRSCVPLLANSNDDIDSD